MNIELVNGMITSDDDKNVKVGVVARIPVSELKTIGDDEGMGSLFVEFIHRMSKTNNSEGLIIDKGLVDMLIEQFSDEDLFVLGFDTEAGTPMLCVLRNDGTMATIEKETE